MFGVKLRRFFDLLYLYSSMIGTSIEAMDLAQSIVKNEISHKFVLDKLCKGDEITQTNM